ncbi:hypothetical protein E4U51_008534 [Claviceps purpurea]|nr:hypothetical protein E4U51_008534 [Claviceps purpurea]KAG6172748.1 hypothetical protein E4U11_002303 [Claviceps purpurea]
MGRYQGKGKNSRRATGASNLRPPFSLRYAVSSSSLCTQHAACLAFCDAQPMIVSPRLGSRSQLVP